MSAPKKEVKVKKHRFIVRGFNVRLTPSQQNLFHKYMGDLEKVLNAMDTDGYEPQIMGDMETGKVVLLGVLRPEEGSGVTHPILALLRGGQGRDRAEEQIKHKSDKTEAILDLLENLSNTKELATPEQLAEEASVIALKKISANDVQDIAQDIEKLAALHESHHAPDSECLVPETLQIFAKKLREKSQANIQ